MGFAMASAPNERIVALGRPLPGVMMMKEIFCPWRGKQEIDTVPYRSPAPSKNLITHLSELLSQTNATPSFGERISGVRFILRPTSEAALWNKSQLRRL
jgi:hypothetical protein